MWCCWISPGHNPASTQQRGRRAANIGLREFLGPSSSLDPPDGFYAADGAASRLTHAPGNLFPTGGCQGHHLFNHLTVS